MFFTLFFVTHINIFTSDYFNLYLYKLYVYTERSATNLINLKFQRNQFKFHYIFNAQKAKLVNYYVFFKK